MGKTAKNIACTLFASNYLFKGVTLYRSMERHWGDFELWILCMDEEGERMLLKLKLKRARIVPVSRLLAAQPELVEAKVNRSLGEFCWTCASALLRYVLETDKTVGVVSYLDADLFFYSSPQPIFEEMGDRSIMAIEHRFPENKKHLEETTGRFNVSMVTFRRDKLGLAALEKWRKQCIEWCYWKEEGGKLGDQMYLNEWPKLYGEKLCVLKNLGAGMAPWNMINYDIKGIKLIFFHFHFFFIASPTYFLRTTIYRTTAGIRSYIYEPYERELKKVIGEVKKINPEFNRGFQIPKWHERLGYFLYRNLGLWYK